MHPKERGERRRKQTLEKLSLQENDSMNMYIEHRSRFKDEQQFNNQHEHGSNPSTPAEFSNKPN